MILPWSASNWKTIYKCQENAFGEIKEREKLATYYGSISSRKYSSHSGHTKWDTLGVNEKSIFIHIFFLLFFLSIFCRIFSTSLFSSFSSKLTSLFVYVFTNFISSFSSLKRYHFKIDPLWLEKNFVGFVWTSFHFD